MKQASGRQLVRKAWEIYHEVGFLGTCFSGKRHLARKILPDPYSVRFCTRSELVQRALQPSGPTSLSKVQRVALARRGFTERLYQLYGFEDGTDTKPYLSEFERKCAGQINDDVSVLKNKRRFHDYLLENGFAKYRPEQYGTIEQGQFSGTDHPDIRTLLADESPVIVKGETGGGGNAVYRCELSGGEPVLVSSGRAARPFDEEIDELDRAIVTECCQQATYLDRLYPDATNTIRVLVIDPDEEAPRILGAVQRIGTTKTQPLDNFSQGGLSAWIGLQTGTLSSAIRNEGHSLLSLDRHPDTGAQITGTVVPGWSEICDRLRMITNTLPEIKYVGWDVLVTGPAEFVLLEGNHFPDPDVMQVHHPLLTNGLFHQFLQENDVPLRSTSPSVARNDPEISSGRPVRNDFGIAYEVGAIIS